HITANTILFKKGRWIQGQPVEASFKLSPSEHELFCLQSI
ncbi:unnamed protein product, partial [Linum tenue]